MNARFVLESLINDMIDRAEHAREEGNREAFFAYFAMIERGLAEAEEKGIQFDSSALRTLDPYRLFGGFGPRRTEARPSQGAPQSPSMVGLEALTSPPVRHPPSSEPRQSRASGQVSIEVTIESGDAGEPHAADTPLPPRLTVGQIVRGLPSMFPFAFPSGVLVLVLAGYYERSRSEVPLDSLNASWLVYGSGFVQGRMRRLIKRSFDIVGSSLLLIASLPGPPGLKGHEITGARLLLGRAFHQ